MRQGKAAVQTTLQAVNIDPASLVKLAKGKKVETGEFRRIILVSLANKGIHGRCVALAQLPNCFTPLPGFYGAVCGNVTDHKSTRLVTPIHSTAVVILDSEYGRNEGSLWDGGVQDGGALNTASGSRW